MSEGSTNESIERYKDYTYIMYVLCDKTSSFYSKIKNAITVPIVIFSTLLSILNTTEFKDDMNMIYVVRYITIALNVSIALLIGILNNFKVTEKEYSFKTHSMHFLKLYNKINAEITKCKTIMIDIEIVHIINEYNLLCEYIAFHIPSHIRKNIQKEYVSYKMPLLITNTNKEHKSYKQALKFFVKESEDNNGNESSESSILEKIVIQNPVIRLSPIQSASFHSSPFSVIPDRMHYSPVRALVAKKRQLPPFSQSFRPIKEISTAEKHRQIRNISQSFT